MLDEAAMRKLLKTIPYDLLAEEIGKRNNALRKKRKGGRPKVEKLCPKGCGQRFGAREMREHKPRCNGRK